MRGESEFAVVAFELDAEVGRIVSRESEKAHDGEVIELVMFCMRSVYNDTSRASQGLSLLIGSCSSIVKRH